MITHTFSEDLGPVPGGRKSWSFLASFSEALHHISYDADFLCLQEIDDYDDNWSNELTANGYDSVFAMHPAMRARADTATIEHGLIITFKWELFLLEFEGDWETRGGIETECIEAKLSLSLSSLSFLCRALGRPFRTKLPNAHMHQA
jgi:hypothetical protein